MGKSKEDKEDKEWHLQAKRYILDPLTAPEPNQLDGPGSSFFNPRRSLSLNYKRDPPPYVLQLRDQLTQPGHPSQTHHPKPRNPDRKHLLLPPTDGPPANTVLTQSHSRPYYRTRSHSVTSIPSSTANAQLPKFGVSVLTTPPNEPNRNKESTSQKKGPVWPSNPREVRKADKSDKSGSSTSGDLKAEKPKWPEYSPKPKKPKETTPVPVPAPSPASFPADTKDTKASTSSTSRPRPSKKEKKNPPLSSQNESRLRNLIPPSPRSSINSPKKPPQTHRTQGTAGILNDILADRTSHHLNRPPKSTPPTPRPPTHKPSLRRTGSFVQKPSGEMAYQPPYEQTKMISPHVDRASSVASRYSVSSMQSSHSRPPPSYTSRAPSRTPSVASPRGPSVSGSAAPGSSSGTKSERHSSSRRKDRGPKPGRPYADIIDRLDQSGPAYHHGGPYDATLASVNANKKKSPLEAVRESNIEALKATPIEYIHDSLTKHVPLQGTSIVPPGMKDWNGRVMDYEEGADLMREPTAGGGAYKRYDCFDYHPDDLKGKGPSYLVEKEEKENKARRRQQGHKSGHRDGSSYELQDQCRSRKNDESSAPLLPSKDDYRPVPIRMHRHSSAGPPSQQSRHSESHRSERSQSHHGHRSHSHSYGHRDASVSSSVSPRSGFPAELSGEALGSYRSELRDADTDHGRSRSNSAGQRFADGLKRHLGSLRRK